MKLKNALTGALALVLLAAAALICDARSNVVHAQSAQDWILAQGAVRQESLHTARTHPQGRRVRPSVERAAGAHAVGLSGVSAPLAAKARQIAASCGSVVISGYRRTRVAGTGRMSLHASGRAVDLRGNPACIYRHLAGWPGGYSTDYGRVLHVHISLGGREDGIRFAHHHVARHHHYARR